MSSAEAARLFAALGDETRLGLLAKLASHGPASITRLGEDAPVTRQAVRKHLEVLAGAGLVRGEQRGREHIWVVQPARFVEAHAYLDAVSAQWDGALDRLRRHLE